jgi:hypothetical protein
MFYKTSSSLNILIKSKLLGFKKILLYDGEYRFNESFYTVVKLEDGEAVNAVYRYPASKIGRITLNKDGTADYCGEYKWKIV